MCTLLVQIASMCQFHPGKFALERLTLVPMSVEGTSRPDRNRFKPADITSIEQQVSLNEAAIFLSRLKLSFQNNLKDRTSEAPHSIVNLLVRHARPSAFSKACCWNPSPSEMFSVFRFDFTNWIR